MPDFDWRSPEAYSDLQNADLRPVSPWECPPSVIPNTETLFLRTDPSRLLQPSSGKKWG